jgi:hypothetical protein
MFTSELKPSAPPIEQKPEYPSLSDYKVIVERLRYHTPLTEEQRKLLDVVREKSPYVDSAHVSALKYMKHIWGRRNQTKVKQSPWVHQDRVDEESSAINLRSSKR